MSKEKLANINTKLDNLIKEEKIPLRAVLNISKEIDELIFTIIRIKPLLVKDIN